MSTAAVRIHRHGPPAEVLEVETLDLDSPAANQALVQMLFAPINPVDLNIIEGNYGSLPSLPAVMGTEGVGRVLKAGANSGVSEGDHVVVAHKVGTWRNQLVVDAEALFPVPKDIPLQQAAMIRINPPTAWRMLHDFVVLQPGDWVVQNAGNSGVGRAVIQLAKQLGVRTVSAVRRPELIDELKASGADAVLLDDDDFKARAREITAGSPVRLALNAVGGDSALRISNLLAPGGTTVTYGAMSRQPVRIPNGLLIFKDLRWAGFWITRWYEHASHHEVMKMFERIFPLLQSGELTSPVEKIHPLAQAREAAAHAHQSKREGKILLQLDPAG